MFKPPVVDSLAVRVVVDSAFDLFIADTAHPLAKIEHTRRIAGRETSTLAGEWGLSLHLEAAGAAGKSQYLLDFGYTPEVLIRNFDLLGIEPERLDGLILSHGHRDHFGGLQGFVARYRERMAPDLRLYAGGEETFREKWRRRKDAEPVPQGVINRQALADAHVGTVCCDTVRALQGAFSTGPIARQSFENPPETTLVEPGPKDHFTEDERQGRLVPDRHPDEHATCYVVQDRGLVVISSCGHSGIINTVQTAIAASGVSKLHAVIGGFHLGPAPLDYVDHTIDELERLNPDLVVPMHCTGRNFIHKVLERMPERVLPTNIGTRFTFGV
jgi:7,8-dihydropterin-6-yl-methyl-4-(beta-D-ribofuranosyl)aminobenzene 5'-phosphate synthase